LSLRYWAYMLPGNVLIPVASVLAGHPGATKLATLSLILTMVVTFLFAAVSAWAVAMISITPISGMTLTTLIVAAVVLGATLAAAGLTMQMVFRNPLVEPGFLGVSQGAAFGAAIGIATALLLIGVHCAIVGANAQSPPRLDERALIGGLTAFVVVLLAITFAMHRTFRHGPRGR